MECSAGREPLKFQEQEEQIIRLLYSLLPGPSAPILEMAVIGALKAAVLASGLAFNEENSAEDLLVTLLKQRQPSLLSPQDGSAVALAPGSLSRSGSKRSDPLTDSHNYVGSDMSNDPYLEQLRDRRKVPLACGSLRQDLRGDIPLLQTRIDKLASIAIADVVLYNEHVARGEQRHVMAAVVAIVSQETRDKKINLKLQVRRLYGYHDLLRILDSISSYRQIPKIKGLSYNVLKGVSESEDVSCDDKDLVKARQAFKAMEEKVKTFFSGFNGLYHKVEVVALSDFETYISADQVHAVMHLTLHPDVLENVGSSPDCDWPAMHQCREMLHVTTVVWKSFVNTKKWTLHRIKLSPAAWR
jgi:hypothetical protein